MTDSTVVKADDAIGHDSRVRLAALCLLVAVWLAFSYPAFTGNVLFPTEATEFAFAAPESAVKGDLPNSLELELDAFSLYYPWRSYLHDELRDLHLPLWDPYRFSGVPYAANPQTGIFYPPNWLFAAGDVLTIYTWLILGSMLLSTLLMFWFLSDLRLHPAASALGGIVFGYSGFFMAWRVHPTFSDSGIWLPLILLGFERIRRGRGSGFPIAAVGLTLSVLGGHTQVALLVWLGAGVWASVSAISVGLVTRSVRKTSAMVAAIAGTFTVAALLGSLQVLPTAELSQHITRGVESLESVRAAALLAQEWMLLLVPDSFGTPLAGVYEGSVNYTETALYAGAGTLILALFALAFKWDRRAAAAVAIGLIGAGCAWGTDLYSVLYETIPGVSRMRAITRFVYLIDVALAILAAIGLDHLIRRRRGAWMRLVTSAGAVAAAVVVIGLLGTSRESLSRELLEAGVTRTGLLLALATAAAAAVLIKRNAALALALPLIVAADLWLFGFGYHPFREPAPIYPRLPEVEALRSDPEDRARFARIGGGLLPYNAGLPYRVFDIEGSDSFILRRYAELLSLARDQNRLSRTLNIVGDFSPASSGSPVFSLLGVDRLVALPSVEGDMHEGRVSVLRRAGAFPPAFATSCWEPVEAGDASKRMAGMTGAELRSLAIVDQVEEGDEIEARKINCDSFDARVELYEPERVRISVSATAQSMLVLTDPWFPGWEAEVDGKPARVLVAYHALRAVEIPPGEHTVTFTFRPSWLLTGAVATILGALLALALAFALRRSGSLEDAGS